MYLPSACTHSYYASFGVDINPGLCGSSSKVSVTYTLLMYMKLHWVFVEAYVGTVTSPQIKFSTIIKVNEG